MALQTTFIKTFRAKPITPRNQPGHGAAVCRHQLSQPAGARHKSKQLFSTRKKKKLTLLRGCKVNLPAGFASLAVVNNSPFFFSVAKKEHLRAHEPTGSPFSSWLRVNFAFRARPGGCVVGGELLETSRWEAQS